MGEKLEKEFNLLKGEKKGEVAFNSSADTTQPVRRAQKDRKKKQKVHFYSSFCPHPAGVTFESQERDEDIILLIRRSFVVNIPWIAIAVLLMFIPISFLFLPPLPYFDNLSFLTIVAALLFYYLAILGFVLVEFSLWYFHVGLVTNKRVLDVDLHGVLSRHVAETRLSLIQDVSYKQIGFLRSLFRYGDVFIQTAGTQQNIQFDRAPRPVLVAQYIGDLIGRPSHEA